MNENRYTVMVVDDEAPNRLLMQAALSRQYQVKTATSGIECLDFIQMEPVDLILLDVCMPNMDGYDVCKKIRAQTSTKQIPVIFLSAYAMLSDKLKGYEVGGDDYITKPCELEEVLAKVKRNIFIDTANKESLCNARDMAMVAMTNTSEIGLVQQFYEKSFTCDSIQELAQEVINTCQMFGLSCCLQVKMTFDTLRFSSTGGDCTSLEIDVMELMGGTDRILNFGKRTLFNFDIMTLLIKNMPFDDEVKCGRLSDHLASLLNGAEARVLNIDVEEQQRKRIISDLRGTLDNVNSAIKGMESNIRNREKQTTEIISLLLDELNVGFSGLEFTASQKEFFIGLVNSHMDKIISLHVSDAKIEKKFDSVAKDIHDLISLSQ